MFLQDPTNQDVVPVVKELQRRLLPSILTNQGDEQSYPSPPDIGVDEENGMLRKLIKLAFYLPHHIS